MEFELNKWIQERNRPTPQKFGNPKIIRAGQELDVRSWIEEGREDTELYKTLEKYGCIDRMIVNKEQVFGDLTEIMDLRNSMDQMREANKLWEGLPLDFRKEFLNDKNEFMRNGIDYLKKKIEEEKTEKPIKTQPIETQPIESINQKAE